jgi:hypothetical protein
MGLEALSSNITFGHGRPVQFPKELKKDELCGFELADRGANSVIWTSNNVLGLHRSKSRLQGFRRSMKGLKGVR